MMLADLNPAMTMMGAQHGYGASAQHTVSGQQQCTVGLHADIVLTSVHSGVSRVVRAQEHDNWRITSQHHHHRAPPLLSLPVC